MPNIIRELSASFTRCLTATGGRLDTDGISHGADLGAHVLQHATHRAGIEAGEVEEVILGVGRAEAANGGNIARQSSLRAGFPVSTSSLVVSQACASGLEAIVAAAHHVVVEGVLNPFDV